MESSLIRKNFGFLIGFLEDHFAFRSWSICNEILLIDIDNYFRIDIYIDNYFKEACYIIRKERGERIGFLIIFLEDGSFYISLLVDNEIVL